MGTRSHSGLFSGRGLFFRRRVAIRDLRLMHATRGCVTQLGEAVGRVIEF